MIVVFGSHNIYLHLFDWITKFIKTPFQFIYIFLASCQSRLKNIFQFRRRAVLKTAQLSHPIVQKLTISPLFSERAFALSQTELHQKSRNAVESEIRGKDCFEFHACRVRFNFISTNTANYTCRNIRRFECDMSKPWRKTRNSQNVIKKCFKTVFWLFSNRWVCF